MRLSQIHVYPLKSGAPLSPPSAAVEPWGLRGDRRWMVVDETGDLVSARTEHRLLQVQATPQPDGGLVLDAPGESPVTVPLPRRPVERVEVHGTGVLAVGADDAAHEWVCRVLGRPGLRLVWFADPSGRPVSPAFGRPGDTVSLADAVPLLLATTSALARLNEWLVAEAVEREEAPPKPLGMDRFRPNLVVEDVAEPFAEDGWLRVRVGETVFRAAGPCARCRMTTIDRHDLSTAKEPIRTLARHRGWDGKTWFGVNLLPDTRGTVRVGDAVERLA